MVIQWWYNGNMDDDHDYVGDDDDVDEGKWMIQLAIAI